MEPIPVLAEDRRSLHLGSFYGLPRFNPFWATRCFTCLSYCTDHRKFSGRKPGKAMWLSVAERCAADTAALCV